MLVDQCTMRRLRFAKTKEVVKLGAEIAARLRMNVTTDGVKGRIDALLRGRKSIP
jgi:hypothetical protein